MLRKGLKSDVLSRAKPLVLRAAKESSPRKSAKMIEFIDFVFSSAQRAKPKEQSQQNEQILEKSVLRKGLRTTACGLRKRCLEKVLK